MKIGLAGNYGHLNLGDEALLLGAIECVTRDAGISSEDIVVLSDSKDDTDVRLTDFGCQVRQLKRPYYRRAVRLPLVVADIFRSLEGLDWLIFGGGGLLNDSNRTAMPMYTVIRVLAWMRGIRVAWWSIGIGPLQNGVRRLLARWLLSSSDFVSVRDEYSGGIVADLLGKNVIVTPDLAHAIEYSPSDVAVASPTIAVSVIPYNKVGVWFESKEGRYLNYCEKMANAIRSLLSARPDLDIRLIPVSLRQDEAAIMDIMRVGDFGSECRIQVCRPDSIHSLLAEINQATLVIATRFHSVVMATLARVPVVTIAYQPKVSSYTRELDANYPCFDIEEFSSEDIVDASLKMIDNAKMPKEQLRRINAERRENLSAAIACWRDLL